MLVYSKWKFRGLKKQTLFLLTFFKHSHLVNYTQTTGEGYNIYIIKSSVMPLLQMYMHKGHYTDI